MTLAQVTILAEQHRLAHDPKAKPRTAEQGTLADLLMLRAMPVGR